MSGRPTGTGTVVVRPEPDDSSSARALVAAMVVDIEERYADTGEAMDPAVEWALDGVDVVPPRGVFGATGLPILAGAGATVPCR